MGPRFTTILRTLGLASAVLAITAPAAAQRSRATAHEPLVVGGSFGFDSSSADNYPGGPEIGGLIEVPLSRDWQLRGDVGIGFWDDEGPPPFNDDDDIELRRHRITANLIRTIIPMDADAGPSTRAAAPASTATSSARATTPPPSASRAWAASSTRCPDRAGWSAARRSSR